jgi:hypothetical protein
MRPVSLLHGGRSERNSAQPSTNDRHNQRIDRPLLPASCPMCGHRVRPAGVRGQVSGNRCHYRRLGGTAAALLPQPRRSRPLVVVPVDTDRSAGRAADSGCPTHLPHRRRASESVPHNGHLQWLRWGGRVAVVSSSRASGPVGGHPDQDGSGQADVRCGQCPPGVATSPLGRTAAEPAADTSDRSAAAVRGCCPRFRTPRTARRSPSWPASGRDRYRNRSPGRRPLVGCSQRW